MVGAATKHKVRGGKDTYGRQRKGKRGVGGLGWGLGLVGGGWGGSGAGRGWVCLPPSLASALGALVLQPAPPEPVVHAL